MNKAIGITQNDGKRVYRVPEGSFSLFCSARKLKELYIFRGTTSVICDNNVLTNIYIPKGLERLKCENNNLHELKLPSSMTWITCDKELFPYDECKVPVVNILY